MRGTTTTRPGPVGTGCAHRHRRPRCRRHSHREWTNSGGPVTNTYTPARQPKTKTITGTAGLALASWGYTHDGLTRQRSQAHTDSALGNSGTFGYVYDDHGRTTTFSAGSDTTTYSWDPNNNRTGVTTGTDSVTFAYRADNAITDVTSAGNTRTYVYDAAGRLSNDGECAYLYDGFDRLTDTTERDAGQTACGNPATPDTSSQSYDGNGAIRTRTDTTGTTTYLQDPILGAPLTQSRAGADTHYLYATTPTPLADVHTGPAWITEALHHDGYGNIAATTINSVTGCVVRYDPFGNAIDQAPTSTKPCNNAAATTPNEQWYRSGLRDDTTGSYQYGARTYRPDHTGTWTTPDTATPGATAHRPVDRYGPLDSQPLHLRQRRPHQPPRSQRPRPGHRGLGATPRRSRRRLHRVIDVGPKDLR